MQSFGTFLGDNKSMAVLVILIGIVVVVALALLAYRGLFGRRLHMAGGRSRQPRLGVVDAFDLDRQRQLVLVRRDNVEHLIMIGGPNDLVIESAFVRAQPSIQLPNGREKDVPLPVPPAPPVVASLPVAAASAAPPPPAPIAVPEPPAPEPVRRPDAAEAAPLRGTTAPMDLAHPVAASDLGFLADLPAPGPVVEPARSASPAVDNSPAPAPPSPPVAEPPPPPAPTRPIFPRTPAPARPGGLAGALPPRPPLTTLRPTGSAPTAARPTLARPPLPLQRGTSAASLRRDQPQPGTAAATDSPAPAATPAPLVPADTDPTLPASTGSPAPAELAPRPDTPLPITLDSIESLEEEMAKLLGRAGADKK